MKYSLYWTSFRQIFKMITIRISKTTFWKKGPMYLRVKTSEQYTILVVDDFASNSYMPGNSYMHQWTGSSLVQVLACHLFGDNYRSHHPVMTTCQWDPGDLKLIEISIQTPNISFKENLSENIDCIISAILFSLRCGKVHALLLRKIHTPVGITKCLTISDKQQAHTNFWKISPRTFQLASRDICY